MIDIRLGDCAAVLATFSASSIDLTVTSPPYGNLREYHGFCFDFHETARQLLRVTKNGGVVVWVVSDETKNGSESGDSFRQVLYFKEIGFNIYDTMIYRKENFISLTHRRYEQEFEYMFVFSKGTPKTFNPIMVETIGAGEKYNLTRKGYGFKEGAFRRGDRDVVIKKHKQHGNIFTYPTGNSGNNHPAVFPLELARDHILSWSNPGDVVLDPFCGSGTCGVASERYGRNFIGIDISPEYCKMAKDRLDIESSQLKFSLT